MFNINLELNNLLVKKGDGMIVKETTAVYDCKKKEII